jgi:hypothetical protein
MPLLSIPKVAAANTRWSRQRLRRSLYRGFLAFWVSLFSEAVPPHPALRLSFSVSPLQWKTQTMFKRKPETKRFSVAINLTAPGSEIAAEFVIPRLVIDQGDGFIGLETGKSVTNALICLTGPPITTNDVITKFSKHSKLPVPVRKAQEVLNRYIVELQEFDLGNVLSIEYGEDGGYSLTRVAKRPPPLHKPKLPG